MKRQPPRDKKPPTPPAAPQKPRGNLRPAAAARKEDNTVKAQPAKKVRLPDAQKPPAATAARPAPRSPPQQAAAASRETGADKERVRSRGSMRCYLLDSCCLGCSLRDGVKLLGIAYAVFGFLMFLWFTYLFSNDGLLKHYPRKITTHKPPGDEDLGTTTNATNSTDLNVTPIPGMNSTKHSFRLSPGMNSTDNDTLLNTTTTMAVEEFVTMGDTRLTRPVRGAVAFAITILIVIAVGVVADVALVAAVVKRIVPYICVWTIVLAVRAALLQIVAILILLSCRRGGDVCSTLQAIAYVFLACFGFFVYSILAALSLAVQCERTPTFRTSALLSVA